jgi:hypothetical protein
MSTITIQCPRTGQPISTGIETDEYSFTQLPGDVPSHARCPLCGQAHVWRKRDAWLGIGVEPQRAAKVA